MPRYTADDELAMASSDRRQSQIMETCLNLQESLQKLRAQIRELAQKAEPVLLPDTSPRLTNRLQA